MFHVYKISSVFHRDSCSARHVDSEVVNRVHLTAVTNVRLEPKPRCFLPYGSAGIMSVVKYRHHILEGAAWQRA